MRQTEKAMISKKSVYTMFTYISIRRIYPKDNLHGLNFAIHKIDLFKSGDSQVLNLISFMPILNREELGYKKNAPIGAWM